MKSPRHPLASLAAVAVLAALSVAACGGGAAPSPSASPSPSTPPSAPPAAAPAAELPGTTWFVTGFAGPTGVATAVIPGTTVTLDFGRDGNAGGNGGCNRYGGDFSTDPGTGTLAFGPLIRTEMACTPDSTTTQENGYLVALERTTAHRIADGRLQLLDSSGTVVVEAEPAPTS
jgi:heat shock protein HslJ